MNRGYIKLWRKIMNNPYYREKRKLSRFEAWIDLILNANGKEKEILFDGKPILIKRGQFLTSQRKLAERWGWSKTKTADFLKISSKHDHAIEIVSDRKKSIITILNYDIYNPFPYKKKTTESEEKKTTERPQKDHRLVPTNKREIKKTNDKEINKDIYVSKWNVFAEKYGLSKIETITPGSTREQALRTRIKQGMDFDELLARIEKQPFLLGNNKETWVIDFDFAITASKYQKIMEFRYRGKHKPKTESWAEKREREEQEKKKKESPF